MFFLVGTNSQKSKKYKIAAEAELRFFSMRLSFQHSIVKRTLLSLFYQTQNSCQVVFAIAYYEYYDNIKNMKLLTCKQVGTKLGVTAYSVWRYIRAKELKAIKITARNFRIEEKELNNFLKKRIS